METSELIATIETLHVDARERGLFFQTCEDESLCGPKITIGGRPLLSFGSCSYLGLEHHRALVGTAHEMLRRYGTQFASSRGYLSAPPYPELEATLGTIFGGHAVTCQTTTLAHQAAFDVLLTEQDAMVLDHQVHYSVQRAATLARAGGATVELVRHEELERAVEVVRELAKTHRTVWFATDGITSMYGDLAPVELLQEILDVADNVRLYIDDAHGMSWCGKFGRGSILSRLPLTERMVVATSLAKAFGAGGAALVFSDPREKERVRMCGGPMVFSGPLQPPLLGAALGSARLHLTPELETLQARLADRVAYAKRTVLEAGLPLLVDNEVPIVFVRCGLPRVSAEVAQRLTDDGLYVNVSMYPAVPMRRSGIRCGITADHTHEDIDRLVASLSQHVPAVLAEEGVDREQLDRLFEKTAVSTRHRRGLAQLIAAHPTATDRADRRAPSVEVMELPPERLSVEVHSSIEAVDPLEWDRLLGARAHCSWASMQACERIFNADREASEHQQDYDYVIVRDGERPVAATVFTTGLLKDDMLMRTTVSEAVERRRMQEPYFLTSRATQAGTALSEGDHVFLERDGPWRAGLRRLVETAEDIRRTRGSEILLLRDIDRDDAVLESALLGEGLLAIPMPTTYELDVTWSDAEALVQGLSSKRRRRVARGVLELAKGTEVQIWEPGRPTERLYELYRAVASRGSRINGFALPSDVFEHLLTSKAWDVGAISQRGDPDRTPIACWAAHHHGDVYAPLIAGLDYDFLAPLQIYKQLLFQILERARQRGASVVRLGMTADLEKQRWGAAGKEVAVYGQSNAEYNASLLRQLVAEEGMGKAPA